MTNLYQVHLAAEAAMIASDYTLESCQVADTAYAAYRTAVVAARTAWLAISSSDAKSSAETNAEDTEGTAVDELRWLEVALATYRMNLESGDYTAEGAAK
jgi:hypothetical protein